MMPLFHTKVSSLFYWYLLGPDKILNNSIVCFVTDLVLYFLLIPIIRVQVQVKAKVLNADFQGKYLM